MTLHNPALFFQTEAHPAKSVRRFFQGVAQDQNIVTTAAALAVTERAGTANMSVDVAAGGGFVIGTVAAFQGAYYVDNRGTENVTISGSDPANPRIDLVVARIRDIDEGDAATLADFFVVVGTPSASPVAPAVPNSSMVLAEVTVPAGASSIVTANISDQRVLPVSLQVQAEFAALEVTVASQATSISDNAADITANATAAGNAFTAASVAQIAAAAAQSTADGAVTVNGTQASSIANLESATQHLAANGTQHLIEVADIRVGPNAAGGSTDIRARNTSNVRVLNSAGNPGIGIRSSDAAAFLRPVLTAGSPEFLRHAAGADTYGVVSRQASSRRWKKNIKALAGSVSASIIGRLQVVTFDSTIESDKGLDTQLGLIAEDVYEVDPQSVYLDENGEPSGINYTRLTVHLLSAVQVLQEQVEELSK